MLAIEFIDAKAAKSRHTRDVVVGTEWQRYAVTATLDDMLALPGWDKAVGVAFGPSGNEDAILLIMRSSA